MSEPRRTLGLPFWKKPTFILAAIFIFVLLAPLLFARAYWENLIIKSFSDAWMLVFEKTWAAIVVLAISWGAGIYQTHREKWKSEVKLELVKVLLALKVPTVLFVVVFLVYLFGISPARIISEKDNEAKVAKQKQKPIPVEVSVTSKNADEEARAELGKTKEQLKETQQLLAVAANEAEELKVQVVAQRFVPLARFNETQFVTQFKDLLQRWPAITNIGIDIDQTDRRRRLWADQMVKIIEANKLSIHHEVGMFADNGLYDSVLFYSAECQPAVEDFARVFTNLFKPPISVSPNPYPGQIIIRLMGSPTFGTNGVIRFD